MPQKRGKGGGVQRDQPLSDLAKQQQSISRERESMLYAAAHGHFSMTEAATKKPFDYKTTPFGTECMVEWIDSRPETKPSVSGKVEFRFWDTSSLALELYCEAKMDSERRNLLGSWLYIADLCDFFWSMMAHFCATGSCLPPVLREEPSEDTMMYPRELKRMYGDVSIASFYAKKSKEIKVDSAYASVVDLFNRGKLTGGGMSAEPPEDLFRVPTEKLSIPHYWATQDKLWTGALNDYITNGVAPCMWALKPSGCVHPRCPDDHERHAQRVSVATSEMAAQAKSPANMANIHTNLIGSTHLCNNCGSDGRGGELHRCARCRNVMYCGRECQRSDWKDHKQHCRTVAAGTAKDGGEQHCRTAAAGTGKGGGGPFEKVWAVVFPADQALRPYATLVPGTGQEMASYVSSKFFGVGTSVVPLKVCCKRPTRGEWPMIKNTAILYNMQSTGAPNLRAQAAFWNIGAWMPTEGPKVKVRGDAVVVSMLWDDDPTANSGMSIGGARPRLGSQDFMTDFTYTMYEERWGLFNLIMHPGDQSGDAMGLATLTALTPENEKMLIETVNKALHGRKK